MLAKLAVDVQQHRQHARDERYQHREQRDIVRELLVRLTGEEPPFERDAM
jgi:hypothetical protein